ncbi:MAG: glycosyltransferase family 4 protein [Terrimicrobiaceae bacterium]|nr:glycosyltransferase family 4 protein [Terrimicrobiaceae bacterium]
MSTTEEPDPSWMSATRRFIVATPGRSVCDDHARALHLAGHLKFLALATRRGTQGVPLTFTRRHVAMGLAIYLAAKTRSTFHGEAFRFAQHPRFDRWVLGMMSPGDHVISSYGYVNECFRFARKTGGVTLLDGGNSHPANFWEVLQEEHRIWKCRLPPVAYHHLERAMAMMEDVDYVLSPSRFVTDSFLERGFRPEQILPNIYPVDLTHFYPGTSKRPKDRPLTLICTGSLSLRKGAPYLLEAYRQVRAKVPDARLLLTAAVADSARPFIERNRDLPIEWAPPLPHPQLAERLRSADLYVLPSLEEGLVRTALEALACGLPAIVTPNCGVDDHIVPGQSGSIVPIRSPEAVAGAVFEWWDRIQARGEEPRPSLLDPEQFSFGSFATTFLRPLRDLGLLNADSVGVARPKRSVRLRPILPPDPAPDARFVVATPARVPQEIYAVALARRGRLRLHCHGARNVSNEIPRGLIRNNPVFGAYGFLTGRFFSRFLGESLRFGMNPAFDRWVRSQLRSGDCLISSYGYLCDSFEWIRSHGGHSILDAGNSHPDQFWRLVEAEHKRWGCQLPPISRQQHERGLKSIEHADFAIGVSAHVVDSLVERGFPREKTAVIHRPVNLRVFSPSPLPRPKSRPLTLISTGSLSLRKGVPYLLEAAAVLLRRHRDMRLLLSDAVEESAVPVMEKFSDLPIDWAPIVPQHILAARLREADIFILPSVEEGLARTIMEALSCGLPCIVTENTGAGALIHPGQNGEIVPICDSHAIVEAVEKWWEILQSGYRPPVADLHSRLTFESFETKFFDFLERAGLFRPAV